tara:strand:- start:740 stop:1111 length:372 start_codon:yes stop_codon:yes gene_type:complete
MMMGKVILKDIRVYAFHGCMEEEELIGSDYIVNLEVETDMHQPAYSDLLEDAVDYVQLNAIVKEEMLIRSRLLEHIAQRIIDKIFKQFPMVKNVEVKVAKQNPPIGGEVREVCVCIKGLNTKG